MSKVCLLTGGNSGIGLATSTALAELGVKVILTSRSLERAQEVAAGIRVKHPSAEVEGMALDLSCLESIKRFEENLQEPEIHVLIHNAGAVFPKRQVTKEGFDKQLAVIYLGPFLLTRLLEARLKRGARVVNVVSDLHRRAKIRWDDLQFERGYHFLSSYSHAELAKIMFTYELARRRPELRVNCLHPGGVRTGLFRNFGGPLRWLLWLSDLLKAPPSKGAQTSVYLATSPEVSESTGGYYVACRTRRSSPESYDEEAWVRLWSMTEALLEERQQ